MDAQNGELTARRQTARDDPMVAWFTPRPDNQVPTTDVLEDHQEIAMHMAHHSALQAKHADLERLIAQEEHRPVPDQAVLHDLKKKKLRLKEEIDAG